MPCETIIPPNTTKEKRKEQVKKAVEKLNQELASGKVTVKIGPQGAIMFQNWTGREEDKVTDLCAYRKLSAENSWALQRAIQKAEVMAGRKVDPKAIQQGLHSHDGINWSKH